MNIVRSLVLALSLAIGSFGGWVATGSSAIAWPIRIAVSLLGGVGTAAAVSAWGRNYSVATSGDEFASDDQGGRWVRRNGRSRPLG